MLCERKADEFSLQITGKAAAFASASTRLANQNLGEVDPEKWAVYMFYDHPPRQKPGSFNLDNVPDGMDQAADGNRL